MPTVSTRNRKKSPLRRKVTSTQSPSEFALLSKTNELPNLLCVGDSWLDYPKKFVGIGRSKNLADHLETWTAGHANLLRLSTNGNEATQILSGPQRHKLCRLLAGGVARGRPFDVVFFSAGLYDLVGDFDMPRFLRRYKPGYSADKCIASAQLKLKIDQVVGAHVELMSLRNYFSPNTVIISHDYDWVFPSGKGPIYLGGKSGPPWLRPHLDEKGIVPALQDDVARLFVQRLSSALVKLPAHAEAKGRYFLVGTQGSTGGKKHWQNELHPTTEGFQKIAKKLYQKARADLSALPSPG